MSGYLGLGRLTSFGKCKEGINNVLSIVLELVIE